MFVNNFKASSKVLSDEVYVLLEWNKSILVGIEYLKNCEKILLGRPDFDKEKVVEEKIDEFTNGNLRVFLQLRILLVFSVKKNLYEINFQSYRNEFVVSGGLLGTNVEPEVIVHDVIDFGGGEVEDFSQDSFNFLSLINHVFVNIVSTANLTQLFHDQFYKPFNHFQIAHSRN